MASRAARTEQDLPAALESDHYYRLQCDCGELIAGRRIAEAQFLQCPSCARPAFVTPACRWPAVTASQPTAGGSHCQVSLSPWKTGTLRVWGSPLAAGIIVLALVGSLAAYLVCAFLSSQEHSAPQEALRAHAAARRALTAGDIQSAVRWADHAAKLASKHGSGSRASDLRQIIDFQRQVSVVGDLSAHPLEVLLHEAARLPPEAWESRFNKLHRGSGIVMEASLRKGDHDDDLLAGYEIRAGQERGRLVLPSSAGEFEPSPKPVLFGARLQSIRLEAGSDSTSPRWNLQAAPRSFVRLTDPDLVNLLRGGRGRLEHSHAKKPPYSENLLPALSEDALKQLDQPVIIQRQYTSQGLVEQWSYSSDGSDSLTFIRRVDDAP